MLFSVDIPDFTHDEEIAFCSWAIRSRLFSNTSVQLGGSEKLQGALAEYVLEGLA